MTSQSIAFALYLVLSSPCLAFSPLPTHSDPGELDMVLPAPTTPPSPFDHLHIKRSDPTTVTIEPTTTVVGPSTTIAQTVIATGSLTPATSAIPLAATMGLIMPNPSGQPLYAGLNYSFGFVDPVERPAPTIGGWLRQVQPLLILPDYTVTIFPPIGPDNPDAEGAIPFGSGGLCGSKAFDYSVAYPFLFNQTGWYMFVVNQTWLQPTIINNRTCALPIVSQKSFFAWQTLSVAPLPTISPQPSSPTAAYTVFAAVVTTIPTVLPYDEEPTTGAQKLAIGLGCTGAIIAFIIMGAVVWWARKKRKMQAEALAFSRLSTQDKAAFLAENPESWLNPNRTTRSHANPPAPPGTVDYANSYWQQMRDRQQSTWQRGNPARAAQGSWMNWNSPGQVQIGGPALPYTAGGGYGYQGVPHGPHMGQMGYNGHRGYPR